MPINNILLKEAFKYFKARVWNFFFLFLAFVVLFSLFGPVFKTYDTNRRLVDQMIEKSGRFDYKVKLPNQRFLTNQTTNQTVVPINELVLKVRDNQYWKQHQFNFLWTSSASYTNYFASDPSTKRYFMIKVGIDDVLPKSAYKQTFQKIILSAGRLPNYEKNEIVLNKKFAKLNNYQLNGSITLFNDKKFKIVGIGDSVSNIFLEFSTLLKIKRQLQIADEDFKNADLYRLAGLVYFTRSLFNKLVTDKTIVDFQNNLYVKFAHPPSNTQLKRFTSDIENALELRTEKITPFANDSASGLRNSYSSIEILIFSLVFIVGCFFIICFIYLLVTKMVRKTTITISRLISFGYTPWQIALNFFLYPLLVVLVSSLFAYCFGLFLDNYLSNVLNKSSFLEFSFVPFQLFWFACFVILLPLLIGGMFFVFAYWKIKNSFRFLFDQHYENELLLKRTFIFRKISALVILMSIPLKIFTFFFFRDLSKKMLVFLLLIVLFGLSFILIFFRTSTSNFLNNQWNFMQKDVQSITFYKRSTYFNENGKIVSNLEWKDFQTYQKTANLIKDFDQIGVQNPSCILGNEKLDSKAIFSSGCLKKNYIDVEKLDNKEIKNYLKQLKFQKVFFDVAIYDQASEFPLLLTDAIIDNNSAQVYFIPEGWESYFQFGELEKLSNWKLKNGLIGRTDFNLPYTIASSTLKKMINPLTQKNYALGDTIEFNVGLSGTPSLTSIKVKIAAFIAPRYVSSKALFIDHQILYQNNLPFAPLVTNVNKSEPVSAHTPFNLLLSKNTITNPYRYLAIDLSFSKDVYDFETKKFNLAGLLFANIESPHIYELIDVSKDYFNLFELYFSLIFALMIVFVILSLVLGIIFLFQNETRIVNKFRLLGYKVKELFLSYLSVFFVLLFFGLFIGFGLALAMFSYFDAYFQELGVFIYIYDIWQYLLYVLLFAIFLIVSYSIYQYHFFKKRIFLEYKRV